VMGTLSVSIARSANRGSISTLNLCCEVARSSIFIPGSKRAWSNTSSRSTGRRGVLCWLQPGRCRALGQRTCVPSALEEQLHGAAPLVTEVF